MISKVLNAMMSRPHTPQHLGHALRASIAAVLIGALVFALPLSRAVAQPAPAAGGPTTTPAPGEDDKLYSCKKQGGGLVAVSFKPETELKDLITWVMGFTCKNFIMDPRVVATGKKFTLIAPNKMTPGEAYRVFLVALSTMGLTVVPKGTLVRIVESQNAKLETLPIYKKGVPADEDQLVRYIMRPSYVQLETLRGALDAIHSPAGMVQVAGSMLVITDYSSQIRDMMTLAKSLDVPGANDGIYTIPVQHADATQLGTKLNEILGLTGGAAPPGGAPRPPGAGGHAPVPGQVAGRDEVAAAVPSKILVDERSNTLIVVASEAGYLRVKSLVERLDIALDTEGGSSIHIYPLDNALAEELATTLNNAMQGQAQAAAQKKAGGPPLPERPAGGAELGAALEGAVKVIGDKPTNSLVVMSSGRDFIALKDVIRRLDLPRRQVFIEAVILEVQLSKDLQIGSSSHGGYPTSGGDLVLGGVQTPSLKSLNLSTLVSATGLIGGMIGAPLTNSQTLLGTSIPSYGILFQALANQANTNILSAPHFIAINNEKTEFSVGNNIPYKAGLSFGGIGLPGGTGATGGAGLTGSIGQNIQRQPLNLVLNVIPHITADETVRLEIEHETKDIGDKDPELGPTWTERKLKTQVVVRDQQSVVIGGLISEREIYNVTKVPLLGDIPILGYFFKYSTKSKKKTNLLIMLTPYIIKDQLDLQSIRERKERERAEFVGSFANLSDMRFDPHTDYRRKRGMLEEMNRVITAIDQDAETLRQLGSRPRVKGGAIEYQPASSIDGPEDDRPRVDEPVLGSTPGKADKADKPSSGDKATKPKADKAKADKAKGAP